jgi:hypothetical protein
MTVTNMLYRLKPVAPKRSNSHPQNDPADHPEDYVEEETFPLPVHDLAGDETGDQPEDDPAEDRHLRTPCRNWMLTSYPTLSFFMPWCLVAGKHCAYGADEEKNMTGRKPPSG